MSGAANCPGCYCFAGLALKSSSQPVPCPESEILNFMVEARGAKTLPAFRDHEKMETVAWGLDRI